MSSGVSNPKLGTVQNGAGGIAIAICRMPSMRRLMTKPAMTMKFARRRPQSSETMSVRKKVIG